MRGRNARLSRRFVTSRITFITRESSGKRIIASLGWSKAVDFTTRFGFSKGIAQAPLKEGQRVVRWEKDPSRYINFLSNILGVAGEMYFFKLSLHFLDLIDPDSFNHFQKNLQQVQFIKAEIKFWVFCPKIKIIQVHFCLRTMQNLILISF